MKEKIDDAIKRGLLIFIGQRLPEDFYAAFIEWNTIANMTGAPEAHYNVGYCYANGEGTQKNVEKALHHYQIALDGGVTASGMRIIRLYRNTHLSLPAKLELFDATQIKDEIIENAIICLDTLMRLADEAIAKGSHELTQVREQFGTFKTLLELHIVHKKEGVEQYKNKCLSLISAGCEWVKPLLGILDCKVETVNHYSAKQDISKGGVVNGTTQYFEGKIYYTLSETSDFINASQTEITVSIRSQKAVRVGAGSRHQFTWFNPHPQKYSSVPYNEKTEKINTVCVYPFECKGKLFDEISVDTIESGFSIPEKLIVKATKRPPNKSVAGTFFNIIAAIVLVSICLFVAYQVMISK